MRDESGSPSGAVATTGEGDARRRLHLGVILPNYGEASSPEAIRRMASLADDLGFDSVWATEHVIVGPEAAQTFALTYEPLVTLGWIAGWTERVALGTSILIAPLHSPMRVAKQVATLTRLSGRAVHLGVGAGWHEDEFRFMAVDFASRGRRTDEAIEVIRALWDGADAFDGEFWSFADATSGPPPAVKPEIWVGGVKRTAVRRTLAHGDVWHPSANVDLGFVAEVMAEHPDLRLVPRTPPERIDELLALGAEGAAITFPDEATMRSVARQYR
jgi:probable F420-dependent oxidoreductase